MVIFHSYVSLPKGTLFQDKAIMGLNMVYIDQMAILIWKMIINQEIWRYIPYFQTNPYVCFTALSVFTKSWTMQEVSKIHPSCQAKKSHFLGGRAIKRSRWCPLNVTFVSVCL